MDTHGCTDLEGIDSVQVQYLPTLHYMPQAGGAPVCWHVKQHLEKHRSCQGQSWGLELLFQVP